MNLAVTLSMAAIGALINAGASQADTTTTVALPDSPDRVLLEPGECASTVTGEHRLRSKLVVRGYGEESPIANNSTAAGRALNRRVSLIRRSD